MKNKIKNKLAMAIAICIGVVSFGGCGESSSKTIADYKKAGKITMGTNAEFPPFEYHEESKIVGFDVEISQKIADKIGVELSIEDMSFEGLVNALNTEKIDFIAAGMTADETRKKSVDFSDGYYNSTQVIIVMKDNTQIKGKADLANKKIGVQIGTTGSSEAKTIEGAKVLEFNSGAIAIMDLKNGKLDAVILDSEPSKALAIQNENIMVIEEALTKEEYSIATRKGETELIDTINSVITEMKSNGEYDALIKKYFEK